MTEERKKNYNNRLKRRARILLLLLLVVGVPSWLVYAQAQRYQRDYALLQAIQEAKKLYHQGESVPSQERVNAAIRKVTHLLEQGADPNACVRETTWTKFFRRVLPPSGAASDPIRPDIPALLLLLAPVPEWEVLPHITDEDYDAPMVTTLVKAFLKRGADPNALDPHAIESALEASYHHGYRTSVLLLIEKGADIHRPMFGGYTLLHDVALTDDVSLLRALLAHGARVNARDNRKETPLHKAASGINVEIVRTLLAAGADPNARNDQGDTPLFKAIWEQGNFQAVIQTLLDAGTDINARDDGGGTPLMMAVSGAEIKTIRLLLNRGVDVNARDHKGRTALSRAQEYSHVEIIALLKKAGAK